MRVFIVICAFILVLIMIALLLIVFLSLKFKVLVENELIQVYIWKFKLYDSSKEDKPDISKKHKNSEANFEKKYKKIKHIISFIRKLLDDKHDDFMYIIKYICRTFRIKNLDLSFEYGLGDAAVTGVFSGVIWGLISNISAFISKFIDINKFTNIAITPRYTEKILEYKINFVFYVRILNLLITLMHIKRFKKTLEGRD